MDKTALPSWLDDRVLLPPQVATACTDPTEPVATIESSACVPMLHVASIPDCTSDTMVASHDLRLFLFVYLL